MAQHEGGALGTSYHAFLPAGAEDAPCGLQESLNSEICQPSKRECKGKLDTHIHVPLLRSLFLFAGPRTHHCTATCHSVHLLRTKLLQDVDSLENMQPAATQSTAEAFSVPTTPVAYQPGGRMPTWYRTTTSPYPIQEHLIHHTPHTQMTCNVL